MTDRGTGDGAVELPVTIVIAGNKFDYPHGMGATAHVATLAQGLAASGAHVRVIPLLTPPQPGYADGNLHASGVAGGVRFDYACGTRIRGRTFWRRRLIDACVPFGLWRLASGLLSRAEGRKAIVAYTDSPWWIIMMAVTAHHLGAKCLVELVEIPFVNEHGWARLALRRLLLDHVAFKLVDGFIVMTSFLDQYVRVHAGHRVPRLLVPILVDFSSWETDEPAPCTTLRRKIAYVGELRHPGEIPDLINAFAVAGGDCRNATLQLIGYAPVGFRKEMLSIASRLGLTGRVEFTGSVHREQLPAMLAEAEMLVLLRRDGAFSRAGFPTKLAEYLASGRPVVVTGTGDIPLYLEHRVSAYLSPPGDVPAFASQMRYVLEHPDEARGVGLRGRAVAKELFDSRLHASRVIDFLREV